MLLRRYRSRRRLRGFLPVVPPPYHRLVNHRRWQLAILAAILGLVVWVVWVAPLVIGPQVACGLQPSPCQDPERWAAFEARMQAEGRFEWLPLTLVSPGYNPDGCVDWYVERWIFAELVTIC